MIVNDNNCSVAAVFTVGAALGDLLTPLLLGWLLQIHAFSGFLYSLLSFIIISIAAFIVELVVAKRQRVRVQRNLAVTANPMADEIQLEELERGSSLLSSIDLPISDDVVRSSVEGADVKESATVNESEL